MCICTAEMTSAVVLIIIPHDLGWYDIIHMLVHYMPSVGAVLLQLFCFISTSLIIFSTAVLQFFFAPTYRGAMNQGNLAGLFEQRTSGEWLGLICNASEPWAVTVQACVDFGVLKWRTSDFFRLFMQIRGWGEWKSHLENVILFLTLIPACSL